MTVPTDLIKLCEVICVFRCVCKLKYSKFIVYSFRGFSFDVFLSDVIFVNYLAWPRDLVCEEMGRHRQVRTYHLKVVLLEVRHGLGADK